MREPDGCVTFMLFLVLTAEHTGARNLKYGANRGLFSAIRDG
jgi:hypothetical protein